MISLDLAQDSLNPELFDLPRAHEAPDSMRAFDRPFGFSNPGQTLISSGYSGTPIVDVLGVPRLVQIGGAMNTFGRPGPCLGPAHDICLGQQAEVSLGVAHEREGRVVASGSFAAPATKGLYRFYIGSARALTLERAASPPLPSRVGLATVDDSRAHFEIRVANSGSGIADSQELRPLDRRSTSRPSGVVRPRDHQQISYTHVRFWWPAPDERPLLYELQIVRDDGTADPFADPSTDVLTFVVPADEPRFEVTSGLEFGEDYAWRVQAATPRGPSQGETYRFGIDEIPDYLPLLELFRPEPGEMQPGVTLFDALFTDPADGTEHPLIVGLDEEGRIVYTRLRSDLEGRGAVVSLDPSGRLSYLAPHPGGGMGQAIWEQTLDGRTLWRSPARPELRIHHDHGVLPSGDPLLLVFEWYQLPEDSFRDRRGDRIVVLDRHTGEETWVWRPIDHYDLGDGDSRIEDWTHGNAAYYSEIDDSMYYSSRSLSRITRIDFATGEVVWHMGRQQPSGDTDFGDGLFTYQHAPTLLENGRILLYNNGNLSIPRETRAIEIALDDPDEPAEGHVVWQFEPVDEFGRPVFVRAQGDADRLPNGNTLVTSGLLGLIHEVAQDGRIVWMLRIHEGFPRGRTMRADRISSLNVDAPGDTDGDWDVDLLDLAALQLALSGGTYGELGFPEKLSDANRDGRLDLDDLERVIYWMTAPVD
jgi:hypothetical protein